MKDKSCRKFLRQLSQNPLDKNIGSKIDNLELIKNAYFELYRYYNKLNDKTNALENYQNYTLIKDSINARLNSQRLVEIQMNFELEESYSEISRIENEVNQLTAENKIRELEIKKQKNVKNLLIIIVILTIIFGISSTIQFLNKRKTNILLNEKITEADKSNKLLKKSEENLKILNATKDKFFSIIAHDLKSPLVSLKSFLTAIKNPKEENYEKATAQLQQLEGLLSKVIDLINNLLFWALSQEDSIKFNAESFNLHQSIIEELSGASIVAESKGISLNVEIDNQYTVFTDRNMLLFIIRNLVSNALKFTPSGGTVRVNAEKTEQNDCIIVTDTGTGIETEQLEKLFDLEKKLTPNTSGKREGTGLGLMLCREFTQKMGGKIEVETQPGFGSSFSITIPNKPNET